MPEYLAPGVYIEEVDSGPKPIEGVSTSTVGMVGMTVRGPSNGLPQLVTSFSDYRRRFGSYLPAALGANRFLPHAVRGFFENGGKRVYITRVLGAGNATADGAPADGLVTRLLDTITGTTGPTSAELDSVTGLTAGDTLTFYQRTGGATDSFTVTLTAVDPATNVVEWDVADNYRGSASYEPETTLVETTSLSIVHLDSAATLGPGDTSVQLEDVTGISATDTLTFVQRAGGVTTGPHSVTVTSVTPATNTVDWAAGDAIPVGMTFNADTAIVFRGTPTLHNLAATISSVPFVTEARLATLRAVEVGTVLTLEQNRNGVVTGPHALTVTGYDPSQNRVTWDVSETPLAGVSFEHGYTSVTVGLSGGPHTTPVQVSAADPGAWGNDLQVEIAHTSRARSDVVSLSESTGGSGVFDVVELRSANNFYVGAIVEFDRGPHDTEPNKVFARVTDIQGPNIIVTPAPTAATDLDPHGGTTATVARTCEFRLSAAYEGVVESYQFLTLDSNTPYFYEDVVNDNSRLVRVSGGSVVADDPFDQPSGEDGLHLTLTGGNDGTAPGDPAYVGVDNGPGNRTGIQAMADIDEVSIIALPGITSQTVQNAMIVHCETLLDRFAILDPIYNRNSALDDIQAQRGLYDSKYAALYFPDLRANDPSTNEEIVLPPSGHVAGLYARTDIERGVHKAPANVVVRGITGLDLIINQSEQDILNPDNVNVIRDFRQSNRGLRIWGARCLTSDSAWKYVPVRRLFIFVEESLDEGLQWVVFEPNDEPLWARVRQSITGFLTRVWRDGALQGATEEEAFFVRVDRTTMTQDDIDNGRLIILVGIAPVKPAEFVIVRIQQFTAEANLV